jgi:hypothetical protein
MLRPLLALSLLTLVLPAAHSAPAQNKCTAAEYHRLDFWVGDWDTFNPDGSGPSQARNHVTSILEGCVIHEVYDQYDGHRGESFSLYDATRKVWHQTWVTNRGELLMVEGVFKGDELVLEGSALKDGKSVMHRVSWKPQGDGVRETAVMSKDGGKTWEDEFDILFLPHKG